MAIIRSCLSFVLGTHTNFHGINFDRDLDMRMATMCKRETSHSKLPSKWLPSSWVRLLRELNVHIELVALAGGGDLRLLAWIAVHFRSVAITPLAV